MWASCTHGLGVDGVHSEDECRDEGQARVFEHTAFTCVHEQAGYSAVQTHVDDVEIEWRHAVQQDVQPDRQSEKYSALWEEMGAAFNVI